MICKLGNIFNEKFGQLLVMNRPNVKWFRSDRGGEYICRELGAWLRSEGTVHELTTADSPDSNGTAERLNHTLLDISCCIVLNMNAGVKEPYWAEAINVANYLRNRSLLESVPRILPHMS